MNKVKLKYQISLFGDFDNILPTPDIVKKLMEIMQMFPFYNLLLNTINELTIDTKTGIPTQINRVSFVDQHSGFHIIFGAKRLDFIKELRDENGDNLGDLNNYVDEINKIIIELYNSFEAFKSFNRLALVTDYFVSGITEHQKDEVYNKLLNKIFISDDSIKEWNVRIVDKNNNENLNEIINSVISIDRLQGQLLIKNKLKDIDEIKVMIDINTDNNNANFRFRVDEIKAFLSNGIDKSNTIFADIEKKLLGS